MLKFFRKIRQQLLSENSFSKYLLYAIGEILLVMVGILLALQVSNWNEVRKNKKVEQNLYENLLINLEEDSSDIVRVLRIVNRGVNAQKIFIQNTYDTLVIHHSEEELEKLVQNISRIGVSFFLRYGAYDQITNNGFLPLLQSEKIKNKLVKLYERTYKRYVHIDAIVEEKIQFQMHPMISGELQAFHPDSELSLPEGFNQQKLKIHFDELAKLCRSSFVIANSSKFSLEGIQMEITNLLQLIRSELKRNKIQ